MRVFWLDSSLPMLAIARYGCALRLDSNQNPSHFFVPIYAKHCTSRSRSVDHRKPASKPTKRGQARADARRLLHAVTLDSTSLHRGYALRFHTESARDTA